MPRLRIRVGSSLSSLQDISSKVNTGNTHDIISDAFEGRICMYIKGFPDSNNHTTGVDFFDREDRRGITWSIQVQGRFLQPHSANDIWFGNIFEHSLHLPWGANAALQFMKYMDPTLDQNLTSHHQPWALSPLISTMPYFTHSRVPGLRGLCDFPDFPQLTSITDDLSQLTEAVSPEAAADGSNQMVRLQTSGQRQAYFRHKAARKRILFGPEDILTTDFCYGFLEIDHGLAVKLPGGITFNLSKYWDGQPVRFVCCERKKSANTGEGQEPWGKVYWCVSIERDDT